MKKNVLLTFALTLLTLSMLVPFVIASVGPLQIVATITLDKEPKCIAVNEETNRVYIGVEDGLLIIDGETDTVITEILPDTNVVALTVNPQTNRIYAVVYGEKIVVIDGTTNQVVGEIPEGNYNSYEIAVNPVTNLVYIADWHTTQGYYDCVLVYDGQTLTEMTQVNIPGSDEHTYIERVGVAVNPETNRVYTTWSGDNTLHVIDGDTHEILETVSPSSFSRDVTINPHTNYVYVGNVVLDGETLEEVTSDYQGDLKAVDPVNNILYTTGYNKLYALNGTTPGILTSLELDEGVSLSPDAVAVNCETGKVYVVDNYETQIPVVIPEFPTWTSMLLVLFALAVAIFIYRRRPFKTPIHQQSSAL